MSILDRILGRTPGDSPQITANSTAKPAKAQPAPPVTDLPDMAISAKAGPPPAPVEERMIRVYDQFGRAVSIGRDSWRRDVLLPNLAANRDKPDALYDLIVGALNDDFGADVLDAARHLAETDPQPRRGAMLLGVVMLQLGDAEGARGVLESAIARHGENAYLLANLARAYERTDPARAQDLIWRALGLEPNEETSLNWLISRAHGEGGEAAVLAAYTRAATLPGSWRAQLWLARFALEAGNLVEATRYYEEALARARPIPADLLMQLSGDLGNRGHLELLVRLTQPRYDLAAHGLMVGNNLIRAYIDLGLLPEARKLLEQLYSQQRPDWREHLQFWDQKLDEAEKQYGEVKEPLEIVVMKLEQPVWTRGVLGFESVLPAKAASAPRIHFVCASGAGPESAADGKVVSQPTNDLGRIARALPMFLAEEIFLRTSAKTAFLLPWMKQGGFILSAKPWTRAFLPGDTVPPEVLVFTHIDATHSPWLVRVTLEQPTRAEAPNVVFEQAFEIATCARDVTALLNDLIPRVTILLALRREEVAAAIATPPAALVPGYLTGIEQALAVGLAARMPSTSKFLHQERAIFDHLFDVALYGADQARPRMLLLNALENEARRRPEVVKEYLPKLELLQKQHPLPDGPGAELIRKAVDRLLTSVS